MKNTLSFVLCALNLTLLNGCQNKPLYKDTRIMLGTFVEVVSPEREAARIVFAEIKRVEELLSRYRPDSEISKLNQLGELSVSAETFYILEESKKFWQLTDGAFDITVGPLMELWGFTPPHPESHAFQGEGVTGFTERKYNLPQDDKIKKVLERVGMEKIILQNEDNVVKFKFPGIKIDLGGIAVGYAVDCAVAKLKKAGIKSCLVNAGGDIYCLGNKYGRPWNVAVQNPRKKGFVEYLQLEDRAVSTSGDYEQYFMQENKRFSHIMDPRSGYPANSGVISATVVAGDCLTADALATAALVLGKEKAERLIKNSGAELIVSEIE